MRHRPSSPPPPRSAPAGGPALRLGALALLGLAGCLGEADPRALDPAADAGAAGGVVSLAAGPTNTFNHELDERDPFDILKQRQEEGPPLVAARLHSCRKLPYATLGALLASRGVDLGATAPAGMPPTAGQLYRDGAQALGGPNYGARAAEAVESTTASATKLFDIFVQAAPEIALRMPSLPACTVDGAGARMFNDDGSCRLDGISCLMGAPATAQHVALCSKLVTSASSTKVGQAMAIAALLSAAHTCE